MKSPVALAAVLLAATALTASAQTVKVEFLMGKVNLSAQNASLRAVLTEWARVGGTKIVNPDRLVGPPVTIQLVGVPERQALDILLRDLPGYMLGPRQALVPGVSAYDRLVVVAATAGRPAAGPTFTPSAQPARRVPPPPIDPPDDDSDDDSDDLDVDGPVPVGPAGPSRSTPPGLITPGLAPPEANEPRSTPTPAPTTGNPFGAQGVSRPGVIAPAPPPTPAEQRAPSDNDPER